MTKIGVKQHFSIENRFSWRSAPIACSGLITATAMAVAMAIAMATAMATAVAVIRPEHAIGAELYENRLSNEKRYFRPILVISGPSRPQKWIRLEISVKMVVSGGLEVKIKAIS